MFDRALSYERALGLNLWDKEVKWGEGVHLDFSPTPRHRLLALEGRFAVHGQAIDQRLKFAQWMPEFERRGGRLVVRPVDVDLLEELAASHELVVVAAGKGEIARIFERDPRRSVYSEPQRHLALLNVKGLEPWSEVPFHTVKFTFTGTDGEIFWVPFHDKTAGSSYSILFECRIGRGMDRFMGVQSGEEMIQVARQVIADFAPWELSHFANVEITDSKAWLKGAVTPEVRRPVGHLPSGRIVMGIGDSVVLNDPIAGQGSNCASKAAHFVTQRIVERERRPFDANWMETVFDDFWERDAKYITAFSNLLLEPINAAAKEVLLAGSQVSEIADEFFDNFNNPQRCWPWIEDLREARRFIAERTHGSWLKTAVAARFAVLRHLAHGEERSLM
ncbi:MAG TPA: styrene monooxygenase/indole monooxygenase family protein [Thermoanaerobaculia bacterium]|nr:styrene monooxygenase/indole monooxygenase family protein [Thermoanaerobaculia bacterium]